MAYRKTRARRRGGAGPRADPSANHLVRLLKPLIAFSGCVLVVACLYWGQAASIPIALGETPSDFYFATVAPS